MKLATLVAAMVGLAHDAAEESITSKFEEAGLALAKATGAQTISGAVDVVKATMAELETLKLSNDAHKKKAEEASAALAAIEASRTQGEIAALIDGAVADGRLEPAKRAGVEANAARFGVEWTRATIDALPTSALKAPLPPPPVADAQKLDAELLEALRLTGATEDELKAARAAGCA